MAEFEDWAGRELLYVAARLEDGSFFEGPTPRLLAGAAEISRMRGSSSRRLEASDLAMVGPPGTMTRI